MTSRENDLSLQYGFSVGLVTQTNSHSERDKLVEKFMARSMDPVCHGFFAVKLKGLSSFV